jgi:hypothetical protein
MNFIRLSHSYILNTDAVVDICIQSENDIDVFVLHYVDGRQHRCTEEESAVMKAWYNEVRDMNPVAHRLESELPR